MFRIELPGDFISRRSEKVRRLLWWVRFGDPSGFKSTGKRDINVNVRLIRRGTGINITPSVRQLRPTMKCRHFVERSACMRASPAPPSRTRARTRSLVLSKVIWPDSSVLKSFSLSMTLRERTRHTPRSVSLGRKSFIWTPRSICLVASYQMGYMDRRQPFGAGRRCHTRHAGEALSSDGSTVFVDGGRLGGVWKTLGDWGVGGGIGGKGGGVFIWVRKMHFIRINAPPQELVAARYHCERGAHGGIGLVTFRI